MVGVIRMGLEWSIAPPDCGSGLENEQFEVVKNVHYLHFAMILLGICSIVIVCVSIMTKPRPKEKVRRSGRINEGGKKGGTWGRGNKVK